MSLHHQRVALSSGLIKRDGGNSDRQEGDGVQRRDGGGKGNKGQKPDRPNRDGRSKTDQSESETLDHAQNNLPETPDLAHDQNNAPETTSTTTTANAAIPHTTTVAAAAVTDDANQNASTVAQTQPDNAPSTNISPEGSSNDQPAPKKPLVLSSSSISSQLNGGGGPPSSGAKISVPSVPASPPRSGTGINILSSPSLTLSTDQVRNAGTSNLPLNIISAQQTVIPSAPSNTPSGQNTANNTSGEAGLSSNSIVIICSIAGGVLLLTLIACFIYYRRRQSLHTADPYLPIHRYSAKKEVFDDWIPQQNGTLVYNLTPSICQNKSTANSLRLSQVSSFVAESPRFPPLVFQTDPVPYESRMRP